MILKLNRSFSCAHFYHQKQWDEHRNRQEFGKCFTPYGHGHDYEIEIEFESENLIAISTGLHQVIEQVDHQHLNFVFPEFENLIPTTENLALFLRERILNELKSRDPAARIVNLKLKENPEIWVELRD